MTYYYPGISIFFGWVTIRIRSHKFHNKNIFQLRITHIANNTCSIIRKPKKLQTSNILLVKGKFCSILSWDFILNHWCLGLSRKVFPTARGPYHESSSRHSGRIDYLNLLHEPDDEIWKMLIKGASVLEKSVFISVNVYWYPWDVYWNSNLFGIMCTQHNMLDQHVLKELLLI